MGGKGCIFCGRSFLDLDGDHCGCDIPDNDEDYESEDYESNAYYPTYGECEQVQNPKSFWAKFVETLFRRKKGMFIP